MNNRRMAEPMYRSDYVRQMFGFGMILGACIAGPVSAYLVLAVVRLVG